VGGALVFSCILCTVLVSAFGHPNTTATPTATTQPTQAALISTSAAISTPTDTPTQVPTTAPTATPTVKPTPTPVPTHAPLPTPRATQPPPKPTPTHCVGINGNPWCYDFNPGNLIYTPPSNFCSYFNCIPSFWGSDDPGDGFINQCVDGTYSQSGGESGDCSYHGGEGRPLYSH
jgi:hypothetical protein